MNECYTLAVFLAVDISFDFVEFLGGVTVVDKVMCGLRYQDNLLFNLFDRLHLSTAIKMKNPIHKAATVFIGSLCGSATFLLFIVEFLCFD